MSAQKNSEPVKTGKPFVISRTFHAPRELVFDVWTQVEHMKKWFGPKDLPAATGTIDLRPGGMYHYCMTLPDGKKMWGKWVFREVKRPERLVLVSSFSDEAGGLTRHPLSPDWPLENLQTTTFSEKDGQTTVTLEWLPINASDKERQTFDGAHDSMNNGWGGTMDKLDAYLKNL